MKDENKEDALKPCPFCGLYKHLKHIGSEGYGFYIQCGNCGASSRDEDYRNDTIERWNKRASPWIKSDDDFEYPHVPFLIMNADGAYYLVENYIYPDGATVMVNVAGCDVPISFHDCTHYMPIPEIKDDNV